jgi:signal transduction histidine kinase
LIPRSIRGRLLAAALIFTGLALVFASLSIGNVLDRFIRRGLNERLDAQIALLVRTVRPDGSIDRAMLSEIGPFTRYYRGWGWRIQAPGEAISSDTFMPREEFRDKPDRDRERRVIARPDRPLSGENPRFYARTLVKQTSGGKVSITVAAPRMIFDRLRMAALTPLLISLAVLGVLLLIATMLQLRVGLRPLAKLKTSLEDIRAGKADRIPADQPVELSAVVTELNGLLDENEAALARARNHVANLAHSLKTPLATLSLKLAESGRDPDGELTALVNQIDHGIRHHLGRARAASPGAPGQPQLNLATAVAEICGVLEKIYAGRAVIARQSVGPDVAVRCDGQDLSEMLGNLLDNAWKWATSQIEVSAAEEGNMVRIVIDDDGPGLSSAAIDEALVPGRRLDERGDGHGFGLPIARELVELHGGRLDLGPSPLGGLRATLYLPK